MPKARTSSTQKCVPTSSATEVVEQQRAETLGSATRMTATDPDVMRHNTTAKCRMLTSLHTVVLMTLGSLRDLLLLRISLNWTGYEVDT